jgi:hypothetical protein
MSATPSRKTGLKKSGDRQLDDCHAAWFRDRQAFSQGKRGTIKKSNRELGL